MLSKDLTPTALLSNLRTSLSHYASSHQKRNESNLSESRFSKPKTYREIVIAFSGGLDSHVLLHILSRIPRSEIFLRAVYVNHGLQKEAHVWAEHCEKVCNDLDIPYKVIQLNLKIEKGESLEEVARKGRYQALYSDLGTEEVLLTAHHQSDQAETLLLQLLRGSGVQGLAAMPRVGEVKLGEVATQKESHVIYRPLLDQSRLDLEVYAKEYDLHHIEDPSNLDTSFDRNYLRQDIIPLLKKRWLGFDKALSRTATVQAETKSLLDEVAQDELPDVLSEQLHFNLENNNSGAYDFLETSYSNTQTLAPISITELLKKSESKQRLLMRYWIVQQGFLAPSAKKLQHIFSDVIESPVDKQPLITWKGVELRKFKQQLFIMSPLSEHDASQVIPWETNSALTISSINITLKASLKAGLGNEKSKANEKVIIRFRQGGETITIPKRGKMIVKNLMQEKQVPPWLRSRLPLIYHGDELVQIVGLTNLKITNKT